MRVCVCVLCTFLMLLEIVALYVQDFGDLMLDS
jgi:hypothetical protein